ncbi:hypothetical protein [Halomonas sp. LBP4]|uniref:hypothetical protein n=1 Tax=Halomonas sp. LBP4 TaxID=2044917 RepID=UPI0015E8EA36|nr:hypothetical protein [Halomonas sp. LBP4]
MDEYGLEGNPDYLAERADDAVASGDIAELGVVDLTLRLVAVRAVLCPEYSPIPATLLS